MPQKLPKRIFTLLLYVSTPTFHTSITWYSSSCYRRMKGNVTRTHKSRKRESGPKIRIKVRIKLSICKSYFQGFTWGCTLGLELPSSQGRKRNMIRCVIHATHEQKHVNIMPVWCMKGFNAPYSPPQTCCASSPLKEGQDTLWSAHQQPRVSHGICFESSRLSNLKTFHFLSYDFSMIVSRS